MYDAVFIGFQQRAASLDQAHKDLDDALTEIARIRKLIHDLEARGERPSEEVEEQLRAVEELFAGMEKPPTMQ